jgi:hypothetical protein
MQLNFPNGGVGATVEQRFEAVLIITYIFCLFFFLDIFYISLQTKLPNTPYYFGTVLYEQCCQDLLHLPSLESAQPMLQLATQAVAL